MSEAIKVQCAGGLIKNPAGEYVIVHQYNRSYCYPKGHMEGDETQEVAARREIYEETGLIDLELIRYLGSVSRRAGNDPTELKQIHTFLFETSNGLLRPTEAHIVPSWVSLSRMLELLTYSEDRDFIQKLINDKEI